MQNLPQEPEDLVDTVAELEYLKVDTEIGELKLNSHNSIEIQPKGTPFGSQIRVEENGSIIPMLTFDSKKMREPKKNIDTKQLLDDALEDFFNEQV